MYSRILYIYIFQGIIYLYIKYLNVPVYSIFIYYRIIYIYFSIFDNCLKIYSILYFLANLNSNNCHGDGKSYGGGKCLSLDQLDDSRKSWFDGRYKCLKKGGNLLEFDTVAIVEYMKKRENKNDKLDIRYWIGATRISVTWSNGLHILDCYTVQLFKTVTLYYRCYLVSCII